MKNICIVLDPAHGKEVPGKRSPDNSHREYSWSRERCRNLAIALRSLGYEVFFTNSTEYEIGLSKRQRNALSVKTDKQKFLLSLHNDAVGSGTSWNNARGWSVWTTKGVTKSDECASIIIDQLFRGINSDNTPSKNSTGTLKAISRFLWEVVTWPFSSSGCFRTTSMMWPN